MKSKLINEFRIILDLRSQIIIENDNRSEVVELDRQIEKLKRLLLDYENLREIGGHVQHPLGLAPHTKSKIQYLFYSCHSIIRLINRNCSGNLEWTNKQMNLIYPTVVDSFFRWLVSMVFKLRRRFAKGSKTYNQFSVREIVYLRNPFEFKSFNRLLYSRLKSTEGDDSLRGRND